MNIPEEMERQAFEKWAYSNWPNSNPPASAWTGWKARAEAAMSSAPTPPAPVPSVGDHPILDLFHGLMVAVEKLPAERRQTELIEGLEYLCKKAVRLMSGAPDELAKGLAWLNTEEGKAFIMSEPDDSPGVIGAGGFSRAVIPSEGDRLYDKNVPMADGGETGMTAAEEVLAWLLIEEIGVPDDVSYSPLQAQNIIVAHLERAKELEEIDAMLEEGQGDDEGLQIMPDFAPGCSVYGKVEACLHLLERRRDVAAALAPVPAREAVEVKPLEWDPYRAETPFGYYRIDNQIDYTADKLNGRPPFLLSGSRLDISRYRSLAEAKAAAQSDYEQRILSALYRTTEAEG